MEPENPPKPTQIGPILIGTGVVIALGLGAYFIGKKFLRDRESAMNFVPHETRTINRQSGPQTTTRTYTAKELEEARKTGKPLAGVAQPYNPSNAAGDAAVQRSLRTLDEINRINETNRRLLEQQQRQQK